jgi:hypothetical protein
VNVYIIQTFQRGEGEGEAAHTVLYSCIAYVTSQQGQSVQSSPPALLVLTRHIFAVNWKRAAYYKTQTR